ncbi:MAG: purine-nucleoside phosphorylase [Legionellaceae bacterium]|nr:purine-nucleoside phosphorylase [Legionellaceae bacterium]
MFTKTKPDVSANLACDYIRRRCPDFIPSIGVVLGSGLGSFVEELSEPQFIPYEMLPGFPRTTVAGHEGQMVLGYLAGVPIVCLQGRAHNYEGGAVHEAVRTYVRTLKLLGCQSFIATNASGSLHEHIPPGALMLISDHINFQGCNPLIGPNNEEFGPRFLPMQNTYNSTLQQHLLNVAEQEHILLHQGVYLAVLGPNYETAAEIRAFQLLGADAVGMSTVPEVLVAHHCGMQVAAIATITNYATGVVPHSEHSHESVLEVAHLAADHLKTLLKKSIAQWPV